MKLSVIIPCFNAASSIEKTLASLADQEWSEPWDVIIADNGSTDNTVQTVKQCKKKPENLRIVDASAKQGPAYARNVGASHSSAEAYIFCDADDEVAPGWLMSLGKALLKYDFVASRFETFTFDDNLEIKDHVQGPQGNGLQQLWYSPYAFHASACGLGIKHAVHEKVNGFDETMLSLEDTDYCIRVQQNGFDLHFVSDAVVYYRLRPTVKGLLRQRRLWGRSNIILYKKYRLSRPGLKKSVKMWLNFFLSIFVLILRLPTIVVRKKRFVFIRSLGYLLGQIQGIMVCRVPPV